MTFGNTGQLNTNEKNPSINEHGNIKIKGNRTVALQSKRYYTRNIAYCSSFTRRGIIYIVFLSFKFSTSRSRGKACCILRGLQKSPQGKLGSINTTDFTWNLSIPAVHFKTSLPGDLILIWLHENGTKETHKRKDKATFRGCVCGHQLPAAQ